MFKPRYTDVLLAAIATDTSTLISVTVMFAVICFQLGAILLGAQLFYSIVMVLPAAFVLTQIAVQSDVAFKEGESEARVELTPDVVSYGEQQRTWKGIRRVVRRCGLIVICERKHTWIIPIRALNAEQQKRLTDIALEKIGAKIGDGPGKAIIGPVAAWAMATVIGQLVHFAGWSGWITVVAFVAAACLSSQRNIEHQVEADAKAALLAGDYQRAFDTVAPRLITASGSADFFVYAGIASLGLNKFDDAVRYFDEAIRRDPLCDAAYANRATANQAIGKIDDAQKDLDEALSLNPGLR